MDYVAEYMKNHNVAMTRDNYLAIAYMGNPPDELDAEAQAELPEELQLDIEWFE